MFRHRKHFISQSAIGSLRVVAEVPNPTPEGTFMVKKEIDYSDIKLSEAMPSPADTNLENLINQGILPQQVKVQSPTMGQFVGDSIPDVLNVLETHLNGTDTSTSDDVETPIVENEDIDNNDDINE